MHFEKRVELIVKRCKEVGDWVYIRESHQGRRGWLLHLQRILKSFNLGNTHLEFRLWIIADHLPNLPPELLENALKVNKLGIYRYLNTHLASLPNSKSELIYEMINQVYI